MITERDDLLEENASLREKVEKLRIFTLRNSILSDSGVEQLEQILTGEIGGRDE
jgi:hypothetical protein